MSKRQLKVGVVVAGLLVALFAALSLAAVSALAQGIDGGVLMSLAPPASQPTVVIAPVAASGGWAWFCANAGWLVPLAISLLSSVATGLSDYPKAGGVVRVLRIVAGCLSLVQFRNAPGSLKAPLAPPAKA